MAEVAERAKVGNATVFRNFPTKGALLGEVATRWLDDWGAEVARRLADESRTDALPGLIDGVMERLRRDRLALDILRAGNADDRMGAARDEVERLFTEAIRRGIAAGLVDPTITYADLSLLVLGTAARLFEMGETRPVAWRRASVLVAAATRV